MTTLTSIIEKYKQHRAGRADNILRRKANDNIQVAEFDGILYLTHLGEPVVPISTLNTDTIIQLRASRAQLYKFYKQITDIV